ncbi:MAG: hypothetical protein Q8Q39_02745 [bacterium]|nr:hypothetical protein [bacterium]
MDRREFPLFSLFAVIDGNRIGEHLEVLLASGFRAIGSHESIRMLELRLNASVEDAETINKPALGRDIVLACRPRYYMEAVAKTVMGRDNKPFIGQIVSARDGKKIRSMRTDRNGVTYFRRLVGGHGEPGLAVVKAQIPMGKNEVWITNTTGIPLDQGRDIRCQQAISTAIFAADDLLRRADDPKLIMKELSREFGDKVLATFGEALVAAVQNLAGKNVAFEAERERQQRKPGPAPSQAVKPAATAPETPNVQVAPAKSEAPATTAAPKPLAKEDSVLTDAEVLETIRLHFGLKNYPKFLEPLVPQIRELVRNEMASGKSAREALNQFKSVGTLKAHFASKPASEPSTPSSPDGKTDSVLPKPSAKEDRVLPKPSAKEDTESAQPQTSPAFPITEALSESFNGGRPFPDIHKMARTLYRAFPNMAPDAIMLEVRKEVSDLAGLYRRMDLELPGFLRNRKTDNPTTGQPNRKQATGANGNGTHPTKPSWNTTGVAMGAAVEKLVRQQYPQLDEETAHYLADLIAKTPNAFEVLSGGTLEELMEILKTSPELDPSRAAEVQEYFTKLLAYIQTPQETVEPMQETAEATANGETVVGQTTAAESNSVSNPVSAASNAASSEKTESDVEFDARTLTLSPWFKKLFAQAGFSSLAEADWTPSQAKAVGKEAFKNAKKCPSEKQIVANKKLDDCLRDKLRALIALAATSHSNGSATPEPAAQIEPSSIETPASAEAASATA